MDNFRNKTKFTIFVLSADNKEDSEKLQKLIGKYGFIWDGYQIGYINENLGYSHHLYLVLKNSEILWCGHLDIPFLRNYIWNNKVYTIKDYNNIICMLEYGQESPCYKPKKIDRTL